MFDRCDAESFVVRFPNGVVEEGKESHRMDLPDKFQTSDFLGVLYSREGKIAERASRSAPCSSRHFRRPTSN